MCFGVVNGGVQSVCGGVKMKRDCLVIKRCVFLIILLRFRFSCEDENTITTHFQCGELLYRAEVGD